MKQFCLCCQKEQEVKNFDNYREPTEKGFVLVRVDTCRPCCKMLDDLRELCKKRDMGRLIPSVFADLRQKLFAKRGISAPEMVAF